MKNPYVKRLDAEIGKITEMMKRGLITLKEGNARMIDALEIEHDNWAMNGCLGEWDSLKEYHKVYLALAKLTRD